MGFSARSLVFVCALMVPGVALAQNSATVTVTPAPPPPGGGTGTPTAPPPGGGTAAPAPTGTAPAADEKKPARDAAGYAYDDKKPARRAPGRVVRAPAGPTATLPGFEQTADGGSRLFVQLTQAVPVEERRAQGSITYVLRGAHVRVHNNTHALVTVHFNTPVWRARLVPQGNDLLFIVDLRANAAPTHRMAEAPDKSSMLMIDFPKGDYGGVAGPPAKDNAKASATPGVNPNGAAPTPSPQPGPAP